MFEKREIDIVNLLIQKTATKQHFTHVRHLILCLVDLPVQHAKARYLE